MKRRTVLIISMAMLVSIAACSNNKEGKKVEQAAKPLMAVEVKTAETSTSSDAIELTGTLEPKFSVDVKTQIPGLVKQVMVTEWVHVKKGQPLVRIDISETEAVVNRGEAGVISAKANKEQAQVAANRAERELARIKKLKESGLATEQSVDDARSEAEAAKARVGVAAAQIHVAEEELRQARSRQTKGLVVAPIDGIVAMRDINVGDLTSDAAVAKPIFRIVDNRLLNLTVTIPSVDSAKIKVGQRVEFSVDSMPGRTFIGKVMYINPELSSSDRSLKIIAEVKNVPEILKGGLFAKGRIITGTRTGIFQIPRNAVASYDTQAKKGEIFVVENGTAHNRKIATGVASGELIEVVAGLKAGEQYVVRGGFNLKDGDKVAAK